MPGSQERPAVVPTDSPVPRRGAFFLVAASLLVVAFIGLFLRHHTLSLPAFSPLDWLFVGGTVATLVATIGAGYAHVQRISRLLADRERLLEQIRGSQALLADELKERRRAEESIRANEERFRSLVESIDDGVLMLDRDGRVVGLFGKWTKRADFSTGRFLGRTAREIFGPDDAAQHESASKRALSGEPVVYDYSTRGPNGVVQQQLSLSPIRGIGGEVSGLVGVVRDITAAKGAERERARLQEQVRDAQKMEAIGRLAGGIAHQFNNLLTSILGYADLTLATVSPSDPCRRHLELIRTSGERAATLTRQLLAYGRKQILQPRVLDPNKVVERTAGMLRLLITEDIQLRTELGRDLGAIKVDPSQLEQVIMNLALNARDAMPLGGLLTIATEASHLDAAAAGRIGGATGRYVVLRVADTGQGMSPEILEHLFEPFFTTKPAGKGTGLGLSTVYGIVEQSGGHISVESRPEQGTTFRVFFPWAAAMAEDSTATILRTTSAPKPQTVMVVEDDSNVRELVAEVLRDQHFQVLEAPDAPVALERCAQHGGAIDLLVTDLVMPGPSGRELADQLAVSHPRMKVLYISGHTEDVKLRHGLETSKVPFLAKPFSPEMLTGKVRETLANPG